MDTRHTQPRSPHKNGKIEHDQLKRALENQFILRARRNFDNREDCEQFFNQLVADIQHHLD